MTKDSTLKFNQLLYIVANQMHKIIVYVSTHDFFPSLQGTQRPIQVTDMELHVQHAGTYVWSLHTMIVIINLCMYMIEI